LADSNPGHIDILVNAMNLLSQTVREPTSPGSSSYELNEHLLKGTYRLLIVAPFDTRILVTPLNPPMGMQFNADTDPNPEIWNSLLVVPQEGQYSFLLKLSHAIGNEPLHVQFVYQDPPQAPPVPPAPPTPPPAPPVPQPPSGPPPGDMQDYYRRQGYFIAGDGAVRFYYVAFRTNRRTGEREICLCGLFAWSNNLHDPARAMQTMPPSEPSTYTYSRMGPFPTGAKAEATAIRFAQDMFDDPTRYGVIGTGGIPDLPGMRQPAFR
jgi:hypothetical protein